MRRSGRRPRPPAALCSATIGADGGQAAAEGGGTTARISATAADTADTVADVACRRGDASRAVRRTLEPRAHPAHLPTPTA